MPYKVQLVRDLIAEVNPAACVTTLVGNVLYKNVIDELLRCDVFLGCMDSVHGRVALSSMRPACARAGFSLPVPSYLLKERPP